MAKRKKKDKLTYEKVFEIVNGLGYELISEKYINAKNKIVYKDVDGYHYTTKIHHLKDGHKQNFVSKGNDYSIPNIHIWLKINNKEFELLSNLYKGCYDNLTWKCLRESCQEEFNMSWVDIYHGGNGCPYCRGMRVGSSNSIFTTNPQFAKLFWDEKDTHIHTCTSGKKADFKCFECGYKIEQKIIANVFRQGLSCPRCSDGVSYPEKFTFNVLEQLNINFEYQKVFDDWFGKNKKRFYDFYIPHISTIIEIHGKQHFTGGFERYGEQARTLDEEIINDEIKRKVALDNNIKNYIVIDASQSTLEYMKLNINNSILSNIFDLSKIDWHKCHEHACKTIVKTTCELWDTVKNISEISRRLKLDRHTVSRYLKQGSKLGWCDYSSELTIKKPMKVIQLSIKGEFIKEHSSQINAGKECGISSNMISSVCNGRYRTAGGFKWMFKDDYEKQINQIQGVI